MTALIILLIIVGLILMTLEVVVIPGFGVAGIVSLVCFAAGAVLSFNEYGTLGGIGVVAGTLVAGTVLVVVLMRSKAAKNMELKASEGKAAVPDDLDVWVGQKGVAASMLRPSGTGQFGREKLTVLSEGLFVKKGTPIKVVRVEAGKLVVEPLDEETDESKKDEVDVQRVGGASDEDGDEKAKEKRGDAGDGDAGDGAEESGDGAEESIKDESESQKSV